MKIALLGDLAFFGKNSLQNNLEVFKYFQEVKNVLSQYDYVIGNFETPFVEEGTQTSGHKSAFISSEPENVDLLKFLGITIVNLANNHVYDFGKKSYELTKELLEKNQIEYFGVEGKEVFLEKNKTKIAFSGYCCYSSNPLGIGRHGINELNYPIIESTLKSNSAKGYNNILSIHAGTEHINYPSPEHIKFARKLSNEVPYVYYGHHPHVLQGIEKQNESLLAYSLGNFCFDDVYTPRSKAPLVKQTKNNRRSIILELEYQDNKLVSHKAIPIYAGENSMEIGDEAILKELEIYSQKLQLPESDYQQFRNELLLDLKTERLAKRDFSWYLKRLNLRSFFIAKDLYINKQKFNKKLMSYINP